jgi:uncharacterized membrane protein YdfJ with MMPL/SSD domain
VFLILVALLRAIVAPLYLITSVVISYLYGMWLPLPHSRRVENRIRSAFIRAVHSTGGVITSAMSAMSRDINLSAMSRNKTERSPLLNAHESL